MNDKSSYSSPNKPQISEGLQNFINAMVEEIVLKGEAFDEQKKKWLKKYSEAEGVNYEELERNLNDFFEAIFDYNKTKANSILKLLEAQVVACFIDKSLLKTLLSKQPQIILPTEKKIILPDNQFKTVKIGNQTWMAENLNVDRFRNGDLIPEARTNQEWASAWEWGNKQPAWCYYDNDLANGEKYGKLYNWYAVNDKRGLAPKGWHVPSDTEWLQLADYLGGDSVAGGKLKEIGTMHWNSPNTEATNEIGFTALSDGNRDLTGSFDYLGLTGYWWSATEYHDIYAWARSIECVFGSIDRCLRVDKRSGRSIRCIKD
jgi:uncharacterized protein (TIGR02145 family)